MEVLVAQVVLESQEPLVKLEPQEVLELQVPLVSNSLASDSYHTTAVA